MPDIEIFEANANATTYLKPEILALVGDAATKHELDFWTLVAQVEKESSGNPEAKRLEAGYRWFYPRGTWPIGDELMFQKTSWGLLQVMGATARELGYTEPATSWPSSPLKNDHETALDLGCRYLVGMLGRHGNIADALSAYNAGHPTPANRPSYVEPILNRAEALRVEA